MSHPTEKTSGMQTGKSERGVREREAHDARLSKDPNTGHGHVYPRPDGVKARCGGPAICSTCAADAARKATFDAARERQESERSTPPPSKNETSDNLSRLRDLGAKLDKAVRLSGMINPDAYTCRYAATELELRRRQVERMTVALRTAKTALVAAYGPDFDSVRACDKALSDDGSQVETSPRQLSAAERLHNLCDGLSEQAHESPFTREEWDAVDRQTVRLTNALRNLINSVRNLEIDRPSWNEFVALNLQNAYRALKHEDPLMSVTPLGLPEETTVTNAHCNACGQDYVAIKSHVCPAMNGK